MSRWIAIMAVLWTLALPLAAEEDPLAALAWISGTWEGENGNIRMEEIWTRPAGGLILGVHRDLFPGGRSFFEYLRIEQRGDDIFYIAAPRGENATEFRLTELLDNGAVFENPEHDFPQKLVYTRDGDTLRATIEGVANGKRRSSGWKWHRVLSD